MTVFEPEVGESFAALDHAVSRMPARLATVAGRTRDAGVLILIVGTQVAWFAAICYLAYVFLAS